MAKEITTFVSSVTGTIEAGDIVVVYRDKVVGVVHAHHLQDPPHSPLRRIIVSAKKPKRKS